MSDTVLGKDLQELQGLVQGLVVAVVVALHGSWLILQSF